MGKTCFVIMPISDYEPYTLGHFKRVYEYIIRPACMEAGFKPIRADDVFTTNYIALDVIKKILQSDMAICDPSARNPNVFYELGIRQAFNLPVTLIRDSQTDRVFDIQGFRDIEYDENLRIDNVENSISIIAETIKNTYETKGEEINSLISLLGIQSAKVSTKVEISKDTEIILNTLMSLGSRLNQFEKLIHIQKEINPTLQIDETGHIWKEITTAEAGDLQIGDVINHSKFGKGRVIEQEGKPNNPIVSVLFQTAGVKKLMTNYIKVQKLFKQE
jgi:hypothetical protein